MKVKILFREYNDGSNLVSSPGTNYITGNGTSFTNYSVGSTIEIPSINYRGKIISISSDEYLTLDTILPAAITNEKFWVDWTGFFLTCNQLQRRVESDTPFEAGAIVFDNIKAEFLFQESINFSGTTILNPVYKAFIGDLTTKKRFVIKIQVIKKDYFDEPLALITNDIKSIVDNIGNYLGVNFKADQSVDVYEGMVDFTTNNYPEVRERNGGEIINKINFEILDKLSALSVVDSDNQQRQLVSIASRAPVTNADIVMTLGWVITDDSDPAYQRTFGLTFFKFLVNLDSQFYAPTQLIYKVGDIIVHPDDAGLPLAQQRKALVIESHLQTVTQLITLSLAVPTGGTQYVNLTVGNVYNEFKIFTYDDDMNGWIYTTKNDAGARSGFRAYDSTKFVYYDASYYGGDIGITETIDGQQTLTSYDAIKIIKQISASIWKDVVCESKLIAADGTPITQYELPLFYYPQLIGSAPFNKLPLDALEFLTNSMVAYIFNNKKGVTVLQNKNYLSYSNPANDRTIPASLISTCSKKDFWDKLNDAIYVKVTSWVYDETSNDYSIGESTLIKNAGGTFRNKLSRELIVDKVSLATFGITIDKNGSLSDATLPDGTQQDILNRYAQMKAQQYFDFYGKRHSYYAIHLNNLSSDVLDWDLLDIFSKNGERYFVSNLGMDLLSEELDLELVSIVGYDYDNRTILIGTSN